MAGTNFKEITFNEAAKKLVGLKKSGPVKTGAHCKTRWTGMKSTYNAIEKYRSRSGCHWDNDHGAGIHGGSAEAMWKEFIAIKSNASMKLFKNSGWRFLNKMQQLL
ncbi:hypothetical protein BDR04DRAFT_1034694, partial [Suillus decipiens]